MKKQEWIVFARKSGIYGNLERTKSGCMKEKCIKKMGTNQEI